VTRALAAGDAAVLVELDGAEAPTPARLAAAIRSAGLADVVEVIPGARTVLVAVRPGSWEPAKLAERLLRVPAAPKADDAAAARVTEIDVCYDGPDLADVAALTGLPVAEVIARHSAAEYEVGWLGFSPGFGYLTGLDPALAAVPRLDRPRLAVPAGSVAIAGGLAAVYPARSPGGWRLLGRTAAAMWDLEREDPALLAPGMRVRFRPVATLPGAGAAREGAVLRRPDRSLRTVEVLQPGPLATVQDRGRLGFGHLGVPRSGAADGASLRLANALVGNDDGCAGLEVTLGRLALRFDSFAVAAVTGAPVPLRLISPDGQVREPEAGAALEVEAGSCLRLGSPAGGLRSYVAVDGGFDVTATLGSRSSDALSGLGPPPLRAGDVLPLGPARPAGGPAGPGPAALASRSRVPEPGAKIELRAIAGPRQDWFTPAALDALASGSYQVTTASNRTGLRLEGPALRRASLAELPSEGVATGSLQVTHEGQPILLLADHPTTGGYPVIAVVRAADIGRAAQLRPGQQVRFRLTR
jgi:KipI family sensor histidine kinase inhibitor